MSIAHRQVTLFTERAIYRATVNHTPLYTSSRRSNVNHKVKRPSFTKPSDLPTLTTTVVDLQLIYHLPMKKKPWRDSGLAQVYFVFT